MARTAASENTNGETVVQSVFRIKVQYNNETEGETLLADNTANNGTVALTVNDQVYRMPNAQALRFATTLRKMARG